MSESFEFPECDRFTAGAVGDGPHRLLALRHHALPQEEVAGRVPDDRELRAHDDVRPVPGGPHDRLEHEPRVSGDVTDGGVELGETDAHWRSL